MELTKFQSKVPPMFHTPVPTLTAEVRSGELKTHPRALTRCFQVNALEKRAEEALYEAISLRDALQPVNGLHPEVIALCAIFDEDRKEKTRRSGCKVERMCRVVQDVS